MSKDAQIATTAPSPHELTYAVQVLDALAEAVDQVAAKPELLDKLMIEVAKQFPRILEALLTVTTPECRIIVFDLGKKIGKLMAIWLQTKKYSQLNKQ